MPKSDNEIFEIQWNQAGVLVYFRMTLQKVIFLKKKIYANLKRVGVTQGYYPGMPCLVHSCWGREAPEPSSSRVQVLSPGGCNLWWDGLEHWASAVPECVWRLWLSHVGKEKQDKWVEGWRITSVLFFLDQEGRNWIPRGHFVRLMTYISSHGFKVYPYP